MLNTFPRRWAAAVQAGRSAQHGGSCYAAMPLLLRQLDTAGICHEPGLRRLFLRFFHILSKSKLTLPRVTKLKLEVTAPPLAVPNRLPRQAPGECQDPGIPLAKSTSHDHARKCAHPSRSPATSLTLVLRLQRPQLHWAGNFHPGSNKQIVAHGEAITTQSRQPSHEDNKPDFPRCGVPRLPLCNCMKHGSPKTPCKAEQRTTSSAILRDGVTACHAKCPASCKRLPRIHVRQATGRNVSLSRSILDSTACKKCRCDKVIFRKFHRFEELFKMGGTPL